MSAETLRNMPPDGLANNSFKPKQNAQANMQFTERRFGKQSFKTKTHFEHLGPFEMCLNMQNTYFV